jgi:hypothetical protein
VWAAVSGAGALLGLLLAGVLLQFAWWGSVQLAFGGLSAVVLLLSVAVVPASRNPDVPLDLRGGLLALLGLGALVYGIVEGPERGWTDTVTLTALAVGGLLLAAFVWHELRTPRPMLDVRLFRDPGLAAGSVVVFLQFFAAFGIFFLGPQWLQYVHGLTPLQAAVTLAPMALGIGPTAHVAPLLMRRLGAGPVAGWGMAVMACALAGFAAQADGDAPLWQFAVTMFGFGIGFGLALTPGTELIIDGLPADKACSAPRARRSHPRSPSTTRVTRPPGRATRWTRGPLHSRRPQTTQRSGFPRRRAWTTSPSASSPGSTCP